MTISRKGERRSMEEMTKEEMQRFLNREAEKGSSEYEALRALADILGIAFPELKRIRKMRTENLRGGIYD